MIPISELQSPLSSLLGIFEVSPVSSEEIKETENDADDIQIPKTMARKKRKMNELPPSEQDDQRRKNREAAVRYRKTRKNRREALEKVIYQLKMSRFPTEAVLGAVVRKKSALKNFAKSTGKHLCRSLVFKKIATQIY